MPPREITRAVLDQIERHNRRFNAYCLVDADRALGAAAEAEKRWFDRAQLSDIDGIPTSIKELQITRDWPTC